VQGVLPEERRCRLNLYHFTARRFVDSILRDGLTRGFVVRSFVPLQFWDSYRWLTTRESFKQSWAEGTGRLPYRRTEVRLTVDIPLSRTGSLFNWTTIGPILSDEYETLSDLGDPENWRLFKGNIPPEWIVGSDNVNGTWTAMGVSQ
jgi:hypothetical protein